MKDLDIYKRLTESHQQDLPDGSQLKPNAEIEGDEYIKYPDGSVVRGHGKPHKGGGMKVHIPDGTKILSSFTKIGKADAKNLTKELGIKVSTKDTYGDILDKYNKHIGLTRIDKDQEEVYKMLHKELEADYDQDTKDTNKEYLSGRIYELEQEKRQKSDLRSQMFDRLFTIQENAKPKASDIPDDEFFKEGGVVDRDTFDRLIKKHNLSKKQGKHLLMTGEMLPEYNKGGEHGDPKTFADVDKLLKSGDINEYKASLYKAEIIKQRGGPRTTEEVGILLETQNIGNEEADELRHTIANREGEAGPIKFTTKTGRHTYSQEEIYKREKQRTGSAAFGKITEEDLPAAIENLYRNFPDIVSKGDVFGAYIDDDGSFHYNEDIDFSKQRKEVLKFQKEADARMRATAKVVIDNPDSFSPEEVKNAESFLKDQTFNKGTARDFDSKLGQFTSGRFNLGVDVVTPEELKDLESKGIFTVNQLGEAINNGDVKLSPSSLDRYNQISSIQGEGSDFTINPVSQGPPAPSEPGEPEPDKPPVESKDIKNDITTTGKKKNPTFFMEPNQYPMPPSPLEAHLMTDIKLQRIDPVRVGIENIKQAAEEGLKVGIESVSHLPPNQRAAAIANMQGTFQKNINDAVHKADVVNANNLASAELFNIGQAGREEQARANSLLSFERRQLTAKAVHEENMRNYFKQIRRINMNSYRNRQELALLNQMSDQYNYNPASGQVEFEEGSGRRSDTTAQELSKYL